MLKGIVDTVKEFFSKNNEKVMDSDLSEDQKENLRGIGLIKTDPEKAISIFIEIYEKIEKRTMFATELMENAGRGKLEKSKRAHCPIKRYIYFEEAKKYFSIAMYNYPGNKTEYEQKIIKILNNHIKEEQGS